jgi:hypothetical protein
MGAPNVCYVDGWHHAVVEGPDGYEVPGDRLVLEDDGTYRPATDADTESWHDRKHASFTLLVPEGGQPAVAVTADEMDAVRELLDERRGQ